MLFVEKLADKETYKKIKLPQIQGELNHIDVLSLVRDRKQKNETIRHVFLRTLATGEYHVAGKILGMRWPAERLMQ